MGSFSSLQSLYKNIKKARPNMTSAQIRAEAERYLGGALQSMLSEQEILGAIEHGQGIERNQNAPDGQYRIEGVPPRSLPRYTNAERQARREKAKKLRGGIYDFIEYQDSYMDAYKYRPETGRTDPRTPGLTDEQRNAAEADARTYDRGDQRLFYYIDPNDPLEVQVRKENANGEMAFLFDQNSTHWDKFYQQQVADIKASHDPAFEGQSDDEIKAKIKEQILARRGQILMQRAHESYAMLENLEDMSDPSLPAEQLVSNYIAIQESFNVLFEINGELTRADSFYTISDADKRWLRSVQNVQSRFALALERFAAYSNPISEFLDPASLADYDCYSLRVAYDDLFEAQNQDQEDQENRGERFQRERAAKHKNFKVYAGGDVFDNFANILEDANNKIFVSRNLEIDDYFERTVQNFGFTLGQGGATCTCEQFDRDGKRSIKQDAGVEQLKSGRPLVFRQDGRVAVLSLRYPLSCEMVWDKPEALFNYSLEYQNDKLLKQLAASDKWYKTRSPEFRDMRRNFEELAASVKGLDGSPEQREQVAQRYYDLLEHCNRYLVMKPRNGVGKNPLEQGHIDAAKALKDYASAKIVELATVSNARRDLELYRDMPAEQIRGAAALRTERANLKKWLGDQSTAPYVQEAPVTIATTLRIALRALHNSIQEPENANAPEAMFCPSSFVTQGQAKLAVGSLIALEMINREREELRAGGQAGPGPLEQIFSKVYDEGRVCDDGIRALGNAAVKYMTGVDLEEYNEEALTDRQLTNFLRSFDAKLLVDALPAETEALKASANKVVNELKAQQERQEQEARESAANALRDAAKPFGKASLGALDFTNQNINAPINALCGELAAGNQTTDMKTSWQLLSSCVIQSMIQLDDIGSGNRHRADRMLRDPDALEVLRQAVETSAPFKQMVVKTFSEDGEHASITAISNLLAQRAPQTAARQILEDVAFKQQVESNLKDCGIKLNSRGKDKPLQLGK